MRGEGREGEKGGRGLGMREEEKGEGGAGREGLYS